MNLLMNLKKGAMIGASMLILLLCVGCSSEKQKHRVFENGTETGVKIEVVLKNGGSAVLICPKYNSMPMGSHGRECYLDSYINNLDT